jgi:hypothetical protein
MAASDDDDQVVVSASIEELRVAYEGALEKALKSDPVPAIAH